jgi:hypothetical protein
MNWKAEKIQSEKMKVGWNATLSQPILYAIVFLLPFILNLAWIMIPVGENVYHPPSHKTMNQTLVIQQQQLNDWDTIDLNMIVEEEWSKIAMKNHTNTTTVFETNGYAVSGIYITYNIWAFGTNLVLYDITVPGIPFVVVLGYGFFNIVFQFIIAYVTFIRWKLYNAALIVTLVSFVVEILLSILLYTIYALVVKFQMRRRNRVEGLIGSEFEPTEYTKLYIHDINTQMYDNHFGETNVNNQEYSVTAVDSFQLSSVTDLYTCARWSDKLTHLWTLSWIYPFKFAVITNTDQYNSKGRTCRTILIIFWKMMIFKIFSVSVWLYLQLFDYIWKKEVLQSLLRDVSLSLIFNISKMIISAATEIIGIVLIPKEVSEVKYLPKVSLIVHSPKSCI